MRAALGAFAAGHRGRQARGRGGSVQRQLLLAHGPGGCGGALGQDVLDGVGDGGHFGVVPERHAGAVGPGVGAQAHGTAVPGDLAHVAERALQEAAARGQREQAHAGGDPLLRFAALPHGHEELDRAVQRAAVAVGHGQEGDEQVERLAALLRPILHLLGDGRERALGAAFDHGAHRVRRCGGGHRRCRRGGRITGLRRGSRRLQHGPQDGVGPVGGQALEARAPGVQVEVLEILVGVVGRHVHGLGDGRVDEGLHGLHHRDVPGRGHLQRTREVVGQRVHIAAQRTVEAPGVVLHRVFAGAAVGLALAARVRPGERRLDAVGGVVREGEAHGAGGRDREQMAVADAVGADGLPQCGRQAAREGAGCEIARGVEHREHAFFFRQLHRGGIGCVAHAFGDAHGHRAARVGVVAQPQHGEGVAQAREAHADAPLGRGFGTLLRQRPEGDVQHVVERAHLRGHAGRERVEIEGRLAGEAERVAHEARQDDGAEVAAAVGRQRLFTAGIRGRDALAVRQVVVGVDAVEEEDARLGEVVGRAHDRVPQLPRGQRAVDPLAVGALAGAFFAQRGAGARRMHQLPRRIVQHGLHEGIGHADGDVEVVPASGRALGGDEVQHVRVVDAQHAHLRAAARARALHRGAGLVEHVDVAARPRSHRGRALHLGTARADARKVVAHAAAAPHGFRGFAQRFVDAGVSALVHALDAVAHGLHEAVDERGLDVGARRAHDAPCPDRAGPQVGEEARLDRIAHLRRLDRGQGTGDAPVEGFGIGLAGLEVLFAQHVEADGLLGQAGRRVGREGVDRIALHGFQFPEEAPAGERRITAKPSFYSCAVSPHWAMSTSSQRICPSCST